MPDVTVAQITPADTAKICQFLHTNLNPGVPVDAWKFLLRPPWGELGPNHGFQLVHGEVTVGAYLAIYSTRDHGQSPICNLAAFCVQKEYRAHAFRLVRALLRQKGYVFTDLSPSGSVPSMNERLGFQHLDTSTRLVLNAPRRSRGITVTDSPAGFEEVLAGRDAAVYRDHRLAPAARHVLVLNEDGYGYLMYRRDRRKGLPVFASPLYAGGDPRVLAACWPALSTHLASRGHLMTLAERRVLGFTPSGPGRNLAAPRAKMFRGAVDCESIDYLYSELTLLEW